MLMDHRGLRKQWLYNNFGLGGTLNKCIQPQRLSAALGTSLGVFVTPGHWGCPRAQPGAALICLNAEGFGGFVAVFMSNSISCAQLCPQADKTPLLSLQGKAFNQPVLGKTNPANSVHADSLLISNETISADNNLEVVLFHRERDGSGSAVFTPFS